MSKVMEKDRQRQQMSISLNQIDTQWKILQRNTESTMKFMIFHIKTTQKLRPKLYMDEKLKLFEIRQTN